MPLVLVLLDRALLQLFMSVSTEDGPLLRARCRYLGADQWRTELQISAVRLASATSPAMSAANRWMRSRR